MITSEQLDELKEHDGYGVLMKTIGIDRLTYGKLHVNYIDNRVYVFQNYRNGNKPWNFDQVSCGYKYSYVLATENVYFYEILPIIF